MTNRQIAAELLPDRWRQAIPKLDTWMALREPRTACGAAAVAARGGARWCAAGTWDHSWAVKRWQGCRVWSCAVLALGGVVGDPQPPRAVQPRSVGLADRGPAAFVLIAGVT